MKKYLFGLRAMLVGAGLMFVVMHGEVSADSKPKIPETFVCSKMSTFITPYDAYEEPIPAEILNCKTKNLDCGFSTMTGAVSCVKRGMF